MQAANKDMSIFVLGTLGPVFLEMWELDNSLTE